MSAFDRLAPTIMTALRERFGVGAEDAAAIVGNLAHECAGFATLQEITPTVKGSRGGYGWAQWTGARRRAYEAWTKHAGLDPASDDANLGYLLLELGSSEARAITAVKAADGLDGKVIAFERAFLRAGVKHYPSRQAWARKALALAGGEGAALPPAPRPRPADRGGPLPDRAAGDPVVIRVQEQLARLGWTEVGIADGKIGRKTRSAINAFRDEQGLPLIAAPADPIDEGLLAALMRAEPREIAPERAGATAKDLRAQGSVIAQSTGQAKAISGGVGIAGLIGAAVTGVSSLFGTAADLVRPLKEFAADVPGPVWLGLVAAIAGVLWWQARRAERSRVEMHRKGELA